MRRYILLWLPMILIAFANATLRELVLLKYFPPLLSHQINTLTLSLLCIGYLWMVYPFLHITNSRQALWTGLVWTLLTVLFEFGLGMATGKTWEALAAQYNLASGQLWPLFLLVLLIAPYVCFRLKTRNKHAANMNKFSAN
jgi:hypothetical protein